MMSILDRYIDARLQQEKLILENRIDSDSYRFSVALSGTLDEGEFGAILKRIHLEGATDAVQRVQGLVAYAGYQPMLEQLDQYDWTLKADGEVGIEPPSSYEDDEDDEEDSPEKQVMSLFDEAADEVIAWLEDFASTLASELDSIIDANAYDEVIWKRSTANFTARIEITYEEELTMLSESEGEELIADLKPFASGDLQYGCLRCTLEHEELDWFDQNHLCVSGFKDVSDPYLMELGREQVSELIAEYRRVNKKTVTVSELINEYRDNQTRSPHAA